MMTNGKPEQALRQTRLRRAVQTLVAVVIVLAFAIAALLTARWDAIVTAAAFSSARGNLTTLRNFLYRMPKGGDLHVHLTGGVYAERYIDWAAADGLSLLVCNMTIVKLPLQNPPPPPCDKATRFPADEKRRAGPGHA